MNSWLFQQREDCYKYLPSEIGLKLPSRDTAPGSSEMACTSSQNAAPTSPGSLLEIRNLEPDSQPTEFKILGVRPSMRTLTSPLGDSDAKV